MKSKQKHLNQTNPNGSEVDQQEVKIKKLKTKRKEKYRPKNARLFDFKSNDLDEFSGWMD